MSEFTFTAERLNAELAPRAVRFYAEIGSTNDIGLEWLGEDAAEGSIVAADEQTKGRGRLGRSWYAPPGTALMFSYLLRPLPAALARVGMLGALAVCESVERIGIHDVGIKWPNDVQIERRKLCGVLPEARWEGSDLIGVVLGIGINVRVDFASTALADSAISLETVLAKPLDRLELLKALVSRLDTWRSQLESDALFRAWRGRLNMLNQRIAIVNRGNVVHGFAEDVDSEGALLVRDANGVVQRVLAGDIALG
jgi:BirA family biotin operon repressor/biotin-[acetyl-CoA-carboxylase] ligase